MHGSEVNIAALISGTSLVVGDLVQHLAVRVFNVWRILSQDT
jgi:hypothetical protein